jgi:hypothetical protein
MIHPSENDYRRHGLILSPEAQYATLIRFRAVAVSKAYGVVSLVIALCQSGAQVPWGVRRKFPLSTLGRRNK